MDKLKSIKIKDKDGTYSDEIPIGVSVENVDYNDTKTLKQVLDLDVTKGTVEQRLNKQSNDISSMSITVNNANENANAASSKADAVDTRLNNIIVESGTSEAEVVAARTNSDGQTFTTLGERLDTQFGEIKEDLSNVSSVPTTVRAAIYTLLNSAAYIVTGLTDEIAVIQSWASEVTAITLDQSTISISGATTALLTATTTPSGGAVAWSSSNTAVATVDGNGLVTGVSNGTATITASCGDHSATCTATVSGFVELTSISAVYSGGTVVAPANLDDLKADLVVTATYNNSTTETVASTDYTLSGTLEDGTCTITVIYSGLTCTFTVNYSAYFYEAENLVFDGTNYVNTGVYLHSAENIDKDFELECVISALDLNANTAIVGAMYEVSPHPGFLIRVNSSRERDIAIGESFPFSLGDIITIRRESGYLKAYINGVDTGASKADSKAFDHPVMLGCELDDNGNPYRYATGTIDYINIRWT